jgi:hypothetical protein
MMPLNMTTDGTPCPSISCKSAAAVGTLLRTSPFARLHSRISRGSSSFAAAGHDLLAWLALGP